MNGYFEGIQFFFYAKIKRVIYYRVRRNNILICVTHRDALLITGLQQEKSRARCKAGDGRWWCEKSQWKMIYPRWINLSFKTTAIIILDLCTVIEERKCILVEIIYTSHYLCHVTVISFAQFNECPFILPLKWDILHFLLYA